MIDITDAAIDEYAAAQSAAEPPLLIELARAVTATAEPMATAIGDPPQLPDVDVAQLAGTLPDMADRNARRAVTIKETGQARATQDRAGRG